MAAFSLQFILIVRRAFPAVSKQWTREVQQTTDSKGKIIKTTWTSKNDMIKPSDGEREVNATTSSLACSSGDYCCDERMYKLQPLFFWYSPAAGFFPTSRVAQYSC